MLLCISIYIMVGNIGKVESSWKMACSRVKEVKQVSAPHCGVLYWTIVGMSKGTSDHSHSRGMDLKNHDYRWGRKLLSPGRHFIKEYLVENSIDGPIIVSFFYEVNHSRYRKTSSPTVVAGSLSSLGFHLLILCGNQSYIWFFIISGEDSRFCLKLFSSFINPPAVWSCRYDACVAKWKKYPEVGHAKNRKSFYLSVGS